jgi:hypothetical protein
MRRVSLFANGKGVNFLRIQFVENYEQYKRGEDHTVRESMAQRLMDQGKARLPRQDQKIIMLTAAPAVQAKAKERGKASKKKKAEGKNS